MSPAPGFGAELRRLREAAALSLAGLGERVHYSKGYLSKIESGQANPSPQLARLCDAAVGAQGVLSRLVLGENRSTAGESVAPRLDGAVAAGTSPAVVDLTPPGELDQMLDGPGGLADNGETALAGYRARFDLARAYAQSATARLVLPSLVVDTRTVQALAARMADPVRARPLWGLASRYAEFAGWMVQERGDDDAAREWTRAAVDLARRAGDETMATYAFVRYADMALHAGDALTTIEQSQRAQEDETASTRVRGLAAQREAQGHAMLGDLDSCRRALDRSAVLLEQSAVDSEAPVLGTVNTPELTGLVTGWCLFDLGKPAEAAAIMEQGIARFAPGAHRSRARYVVRAALARASDGELERAGELVEPVLAALREVDSATIRHDVRRLAAVLARFPRHRPARVMRGQLAETLRVHDSSRGRNS